MQFGQNRIPLNMSNAALAFQFFSPSKWSSRDLFIFLQTLIPYYTLLSKELRHIFVVTMKNPSTISGYGFEPFKKL